MLVMGKAKLISLANMAQPIKPLYQIIVRLTNQIKTLLSIPFNSKLIQQSHSINQS